MKDDYSDQINDLMWVFLLPGFNWGRRRRTQNKNKLFVREVRTCQVITVAIFAKYCKIVRLITTCEKIPSSLVQAGLYSNYKNLTKYETGESSSASSQNSIKGTGDQVHTSGEGSPQNVTRSADNVTTSALYCIQTYCITCAQFTLTKGFV